MMLSQRDPKACEHLNHRSKSLSVASESVVIIYFSVVVDQQKRREFFPAQGVLGSHSESGFHRAPKLAMRGHKGYVLA
jgi:hypothetical protein